jgi:hypothetical protein
MTMTPASIIGPILAVSPIAQPTNGAAAMNRIAVGTPTHRCMRRPAASTIRAVSGFCAVNRDTAWIEPVTMTLFTGDTNELTTP